MDIKLKSSQSKYIINAIIVVIIAITSVWMYSTYSKIENEAKKQQLNYYEGGNFLHTINQSNYGIYYDILASKGSMDPFDAIAKEDKSRNYYITDEEKDFNEREFIDYIDKYSNNLNNNLRNLEYYAMEKGSHLVVQRDGEDIKLLLNDNVNLEAIEKLNDKYSFYMVIDFDNTGKGTVKRLYGADLLTVTQQLEVNRIDWIHVFEIKPISNMAYVYAVPKNLRYKDTLSFNIERFKEYSYQDSAVPYIIIAAVIILILALVIPYKFSSRLIGFRKIAELPIELIFSAIVAALAILIESNGNIIMNTINEDLFHYPQLGINESIANGAINIFYWALWFGMELVVIVLLKHILKTGIREYLKERLLIYRILRGILRRCKRFYIYCIDIDLKDDVTKKLIRLLVINLIILTIMSCLWFLGIFAAIIYTVILFVLIKKHYSVISNKYNVLLSATSKLAEGNLDVTIEEDLGVFNSFKKEIESIQKGFKKAVLEEVKSQNMKTELISNVSHDLKTPLTSIITYVDLLKDENLPEEKRKEYLNTLDRKSQRLQELIEDLFEVSKAASGNINLNVVDVDVVSLMKQTLLELEDKILKAALTVKTNYSEDKIILPLDSQRMFRVFENLVINITKYSMQGSRVYIDIISKEDVVQIVLKNMAANEIECSAEELSERFVRGDKSRSTEGSGLGLAIAKSFVELQGGQLDISIDGDLFKVTITFPQKVIR